MNASLCYGVMVRTTLDIDQQSYRLAKAVASQRGISLGKVVAEAIRGQFGSAEPQTDTIGRSEAGFPVLSIGRPITSIDVAELDDE
jgi:hypothetical protein